MSSVDVSEAIDLPGVAFLGWRVRRGSAVGVGPCGQERGASLPAEGARAGGARRGRTRGTGCTERRAHVRSAGLSCRLRLYHGSPRALLHPLLQDPVERKRRSPAGPVEVLVASLRLS